MDKAVSVIIPAYNAESYIDACLLSLHKQSIRNFEIILVDDCSNDGTVEIAKRHGVKIIRLQNQMGPGVARNIAAKESKAEILAFTDADVVLPEHWIENLLRDMETRNVECVASGYCGSIGDSHIQIFAHSELEYRRRDIPEFINTFVSNNFACHREVFFSVNGFPENYRGASLEDMVFSYKVSRKYKIYWDKNNGVYHHFKDSFKKYIGQQYVFARDTVVTYLDYPALFLIRTHQGRMLYIETLVVFLVIAGMLYSIYSVFMGIIIVFLINLKFLRFAKRKYKVSVLKFFLTILARDFVAMFGVISGFIKYIRTKL